MFNDEEKLILDVAPSGAEPRGFSSDQMVACEKCQRANPPTRAICLYCAAALPLLEANAALLKPTLRPLEPWEDGFNVIFLPYQGAGVSAALYTEMAELLRLTDADLRTIVETGEPLPLARAATLDEAMLVERRLDALGIKVLIAADKDLELDGTPPVRVRALELRDDSLLARLMGSARTSQVSWADIHLFVVGRRIVRSVEVEERRGRRSETEMVDAREAISDEMLLDIYAAESGVGWRISSGSFDFTCLGEKKSLLAAENFSALMRVLRERAGARARYDDSYNRVRHALAIVWPLEQNTESRGWRRRLRKYSREAVTTSDNVTQFTRYSRLRYHLWLHDRDLKA